MKNIAIILAAGSGTRVGGNVPKQYMTLPDGRTVLQTCIDAFKACPLIDDVVVITPEIGGKTRSESSWKALCKVYDERCVKHGESSSDINVLIHDAARPFVSQRILEDVCKALEQHEAVTVAVPATDTIYECTMQNAQCTIKAIPDRATMWRAQTPQAFRLSVIRRAYELAFQDEHMQATDDCGIVHTYMPNTPIFIVEGEESNRKITFKEDFR